MKKKYRIVKVEDSGISIFYVQQRVFFKWMYINQRFSDVYYAEKHIKNLLEGKKVTVVSEIYKEK